MLSEWISLIRLRCLRHRPFSSAASHTPGKRQRRGSAASFVIQDVSQFHSEEMIFVGEKKRFLVSFGRHLYLYLYMILYVFAWQLPHQLPWPGTSTCPCRAAQCKGVRSSKSREAKTDGRFCRSSSAWSWPLFSFFESWNLLWIVWIMFWFHVELEECN